MIGYDLLVAAGTGWRRVHGAIIPFEMPHVPIRLNDEQARRILKDKKAFLIRWDDEFDLPMQTEWWHVIKDPDKDSFSDLSGNTRSKVRRGLKYFDIRICTKDFVAASGHKVYADAFKRYETFEACYDEQTFATAILNLPDNIEFWGVFDRSDDELLAFAENVVDDNACFYSTMWFSPKSLIHYASYALIQTMNEYYLNQMGYNYVSDGARNISHKTNIHEFLQDKFHFRKAYSRLKIVYSPTVGFLVRWLYPFKHIIRYLPLLPRLSVLLEQERIRRGCKLPDQETG